MGQYIRWQALIAGIGIIFISVYFASIQRQFNNNTTQRVSTRFEINSNANLVFREGLVGRPQFLNPLLSNYNPVDQDITSLLFEGLTRDDGLGNIEPILAQEWSASADGRVYVFRLRQDVLWSDGEPLTSDDVVFTLNLIQDEDFPGDPSWQRLWQSVDIQQLDAHTIQFTLVEPFPAFIYYTTVGILPQHLLGNTSADMLLSHPFNLAPVGSGPFRLVEATEQYVRLEANLKYRAAVSQLDQIEFRFFQDEAQLLRGIQSRNIDGAGRLSPESLLQLQSQPYLNFHSAPLPQYSLVYFNLEQSITLPFFEDKSVRQALMHMLNRQIMIDDVLAGQAVKAAGPIPPWNWAHDSSVAWPDFDPVDGIALLNAAGWIDADRDGVREKGDTQLAFTLLVSDDPQLVAVANRISQQWAVAQIKMTVEIAGDEFSKRLAGGQFEAALVKAQLNDDPDLYAYWHRSQIETGQNFAGWDHFAASQALEQGRKAVSRGARIGPYYEFQEFFAEDTPAIILYHPVFTYVVGDMVEQVQLSALITPSDRFRNLKNWRFRTNGTIVRK